VGKSSGVVAALAGRDRIYWLRGDHVEAVWKIAARGMSQ